MRRHQMETFSALLAFCASIHRSPVNSPHKRQWRGALMFSLICVWTDSWANNGDAGDLRRYRAHYDVIVIILYYPCHAFILKYIHSGIKVQTFPFFHIPHGITKESPYLVHDTHAVTTYPCSVEVARVLNLYVLSFNSAAPSTNCQQIS